MLLSFETLVFFIVHQGSKTLKRQRNNETFSINLFIVQVVAASGQLYVFVYYLVTPTMRYISYTLLDTVQQFFRAFM